MYHPTPSLETPHRGASPSLVRGLLTGLILALATSATAGCGGASGEVKEQPAAEDVLVRDVPPGTAVRVYQVDFLYPQGEYRNSSWGRLVIDPGTLYKTTGIRRGFLNVALGDRWVAVNVPVLEPSEPPYSIYFDLGLAQTEKLSRVAMNVGHSEQGLGGYDGNRGEEALHAVDRVEFNAEQYAPIDDPGVPPMSMSIFDRIEWPTDTDTVTQIVTNVHCAHNQCMTMASANALGYLEDMGQISLPHDHVPGGLGDATLVGQLDTLCGRGGVSRSEGNGLAVTPMVDGTFEYLSDEGLSGILDFSHQNTGVAWTVLGTGSGDYDAHGSTTVDEGATITFDWIFDRLGEGCGVVAVYRRDAGGGGHAGRVTLATIDDTGRRWIRFSHDMQQTNIDPTDTLGLDNWMVELDDTDGDGWLNFSDGRELQFIWAHIPPAR